MFREAQPPLTPQQTLTSGRVSFFHRTFSVSKLPDIFAARRSQSARIKSPPPLLLLLLLLLLLPARIGHNCLLQVCFSFTV